LKWQVCICGIWLIVSKWYLAIANWSSLLSSRQDVEEGLNYAVFYNLLLPLCWRRLVFKRKKQKELLKLMCIVLSVVDVY
jgi:hypothetical protein